VSKYSISKDAISDLDQISDYFAEVSIEAGERFIKKFNDKCRNLVRFPNMGKNYDEIIPNLKGIILDNYIIFYQVKPEEIEIIRVVSGYRNLGSLFLNDDN
jgi:toxin ParE1/3/4